MQEEVKSTERNDRLRFVHSHDKFPVWGAQTAP
jgi:hypothetical protein